VTTNKSEIEGKQEVKEEEDKQEDRSMIQR
jgi:hypothetical protein